ncbi:MAG: flagellar motor protein MotD [Rhodanobacter sp.]
MRRHKHEEHLNHEAWAIPYADLMTLLLAFFVVMYAVSVVNEGKYRVMSASLVQAFNGSSHVVVPAPAPPESSKVATPTTQDPSAKTSSPIALPVPVRTKATADTSSRSQRNLDTIENQVRRALQPLIDRNLVVVRHKQDWLEIEIRTDILFPSGVARLSSPANNVLQNLAAILAPFPNPLRVEGFTDNVPISTSQFPSNWELSAARAASVARLFSLSGVSPGRLGIVGWGEVRPLVDNTTADGRNQNRRVLVVVMNEQSTIPREQTDAGNLRQMAAEDASMPAIPPANAVIVVHPPSASTRDPAAQPAAALAVASETHAAGPTVARAVEPSARARTPVSPNR